ncbi:RNA polymerase sigma factor [Rhodococcus koreensis]
MTRNVCLNQLRSGTRLDIPGDELPADSPGRSIPQASVATGLDVETALAASLDPFSVPIVLRSLCGLDNVQITRVLGRELGTVRSQLNRGRAMLVSLLEEGPSGGG